MFRFRFEQLVQFLCRAVAAEAVVRLPMIEQIQRLYCDRITADINRHGPVKLVLRPAGPSDAKQIPD